ncbi:MAG: DNA gyrase inhibitor YacG [Acidobacteriia bacterium]|nr:DNA gyrase inhibitor YacG [Terriglobia bacterium]
MKHRCPICKAATNSEKNADFPFCSERCRERDLGNWATEKYVVSEPVFNEDDLEDGDGKTFTLDLDEPNESEQ